MKTKQTSFIIALAALALTSIFIVANPSNAQDPLSIINIHSDGTLEPADAPIQRQGNTYTFTQNITGLIVIEKEGIVLDGAGYTLQGTYNGTKEDPWMIGDGPPTGPSSESNPTLWTIGVDFNPALKPGNVVVRNLNIKNFYIGIYVWTPNNILENNAITDNIVGILMSGDWSTIRNNYVSDNDEGVFFGVNTVGTAPINITISGNNFVNNEVQFTGCYCEEYNMTEEIHTWDNGKTGNFWSDYTGTDADGDGIGDTPYVIDVLNQDRYPLMQRSLAQPTPVPELPANIIIAGSIVAATAVIIATTAFNRKSRQNRR